MKKVVLTSPYGFIFCENTIFFAQNYVINFKFQDSLFPLLMLFNTSPEYLCNLKYIPIILLAHSYNKYINGS